MQIGACFRVFSLRGSHAALRLSYHADDAFDSPLNSIHPAAAP